MRLHNYINLILNCTQSPIIGLLVIMRHSYSRRHTHTVSIGEVAIGSNHEIALQSMANTSTMDTTACVEQALKCSKYGCKLFRFTAQGMREAANLENISRSLRSQGCSIPLVADIHFTRNPAFEALKYVEKVRINPGNFVDTRTHQESNDFFHDRVITEFGRFVDEAASKGRAIRIGVNHGSLSPRMLQQFGNTPRGMVESCMEYLTICHTKGFRDVVVSMKSSNVLVMTQAVRLLAETMDGLGMHYPLHLGVTEAGADEDGRIKSTIGIGSLLMDGLGDTFRVSLSEAPEQELIFGRKLLRYIEEVQAECTAGKEEYRYKSEYYTLHDRNKTTTVGTIGGAQTPITLLASNKGGYGEDYLWNNGAYHPASILDATLPAPDFLDVDVCSDNWIEQLQPLTPNTVLVLWAKGVSALFRWRKALKTIRELRIGAPVLFRYHTSSDDPEQVLIESCIQLGSILLQGAGSGIMIYAPQCTEEWQMMLTNGILQAVRLKMSHTEFISCPGCGRTLFDLQEVVQEIKAEMSHLKNLKIGVMGCIVNGPGEMADADYGYVGAGIGKVDLYKGKECVVRGINRANAVQELKKLIQAHGDWVDKTSDQ